MRERAEELGDTMRATSRPGTTITVCLPLRSRSPEPSIDPRTGSVERAVSGASD
jgi:hypothetical protein